MIDECRWCQEAQAKAGQKIARFLLGEYGHRVDYMLAYARLCHRIDLVEGHSKAGRILEELLDSHETLGLIEADALEQEDPVEYPAELQTLFKMIEAEASHDRVARKDIQRYRGILDALVTELEEDGSL